MPTSIMNRMSHWQREQEYRADRCYDRRGELTDDGDKVWLIPWTSADGTPMPAMLVTIDYFHGMIRRDEANWIMFQDHEDSDWPSHWIVRFTYDSWLYSRLHFALVLWWTRWRFKKGWPTIQAGRLMQNIGLPDHCWHAVVTYLTEPPKLYGGLNSEALNGGLNYWQSLMITTPWAKLCFRNSTLRSNASSYRRISCNQCCTAWVLTRWAPVLMQRCTACCSSLFVSILSECISEWQN